MLKMFERCEGFKQSDFISFLEKNCSEVKLNKFTKDSISRANKRNTFFYYGEEEFFFVDPKTNPNLNLFNDNKFFIVISYQHYMGGNNKNSEYQSFTSGYLVIEKHKKEPHSLLHYYEDDRKSWNIKNGKICYNRTELKFNHSSQILADYKKELEIDSPIEEGLFDIFLEKYNIQRELSYLFFLINNLEYKEFRSPAEWTYSNTNNYYFDGSEYHYSQLEDMSKDYILKHFSDYIFFKDITNSHNVYSTFMAWLENNNEIEKSKDSFPFVKRLEVIKWLGITPNNLNPEFKHNLDKYAKLEKLDFVFIENDLIQLKKEEISKYILQQHNLSLEMDRDLNLNLDSLQKINFEGTILNIGEKVSLISFNDKQRLRVLNKDLLPSFNKITITEEMLEEIKEDGQRLIKEQEDLEIKKSLELPNEALNLS